MRCLTAEILGGSVSGTLALTTRVEEALPRAHLRVLLGQAPLGPAEALGREQQMTATLNKLLQQLCRAAGQNHIVAGRGKGSLFLSAPPCPLSLHPDRPSLPVYKHDDHVFPIRILLHFLL